MSDAPMPMSAKGAANQKQLVMLAVLGAVLVLVLVFVVIKPFGGSDSSSSTPTPAVTTPTTAPAVTGNGSAGSDAPEAGEEPVAVERPGRNPFTQP